MPIYRPVTPDGRPIAPPSKSLSPDKLHQQLGRVKIWTPRSPPLPAAALPSLGGFPIRGPSTASRERWRAGRPVGSVQRENATSIAHRMPSPTGRWRGADVLRPGGRAPPLRAVRLNGRSGYRSIGGKGQGARCRPNPVARGCPESFEVAARRRAFAS